MQVRKIKIVGTGKYLPEQVITAEDLDKKLGVPSGWVLKKTDVRVRHVVKDETASFMGARAAEAALEDAGLAFSDIDCLVSTSGTVEQSIPCTASLIQKALGQEYSGVPAFDINSTCLSFLTGLDVMSYMVAAGRYQRVLLVATEVASVGLDWSHKESAALFGDGAAAVVISRAEEDEPSQIICSSMQTFSAGAHLSQIRGGGTKIHRRHTDQVEPFLFEMDGRAIYKMASQIMPDFVDALFQAGSCQMADLKLVIPHQGSAMAMRLISKKLGIAEHQLMNISPTHGNTIAASIPMALHEAIQQGRIQRGERLLLLGTSAGFSVGGMILEY
ncbi:beta-ketoacyl-ACP synthase III [Paenibacillus bouchesdurhonensis]|uniref:beta-ketoacyl-ACP synthase III n=1 Tax=Paenibacillus bouchesdurhonensis TaxID=1870990 RepID=UPI000DA63D07|nr:beta-ketoacyl-ACP synthase III [Paenibacillus bouchesdurhonensis]